jgi:hypothetical protein
MERRIRPEISPLNYPAFFLDHARVPEIQDDELSRLNVGPLVTVFRIGLGPTRIIGTAPPVRHVETGLFGQIEHQLFATGSEV